MQLEFKLPPKGNSGLYFRIGDRVDSTKTGIEVQIIDTHGKANMSHHDCGGVIRTAAPSKNAAKPAGEWSSLDVTAKGKRIKVILNGEPVVDVDIIGTSTDDRPLKGSLGLQDHGQPIEFRNIRIKHLK